MMHIGLRWAGEILIPAAGAANVPHLLDDNIDAVRQAGAELVNGTYRLKQCKPSVTSQYLKTTTGKWLPPALKEG